MALIICPECRKEISDRASACPNCGCPISSNAEPNNATTTALRSATVPAKKSRKLIAIIAIVLVVAIGIGVYVLMFTPKAKLNRAYVDAVKLYNSGQYQEALLRFESLGNFKDSAEFQIWCKYQIGNMCMAAGDWGTALGYLVDIEYENSAELVIQCKYNLGISAMENFDWETAISFFTGLNYESSERMLVDCSFMVALKESVLRRMGNDSTDYRSLVTTELAYLDEFRNAQFYNFAIQTQAKKYIAGLDKQLSAFDYEYYYEYQRDWNAGLVVRYEALNKLYQDYGFMADNKDFVGYYINQLEYYQKWLEAFNAIETSGHVVLKDWTFTSNYVEICFKNDTPYTSSQYFEFAFWGDEAETKYLGTTTVYVRDITPYSEYTVRAYYTTDAQKSYYGAGIWVHWSNYYDVIKVN